MAASAAFAGDIDILLLAAEVNAAEAAKGADLEDVDLRGLLGLVRGERGIGGGGDFHGEEAVARAGSCCRAGCG